MAAGSGSATSGGTSAVRVRLNPLAVGSLVLTVVALAGTFGFGAVELAIFAVGAGHVGLHQIKTRNERGAVLAYVSLTVCYLLAAWALVGTLRASLVLVAQLAQ